MTTSESSPPLLAPEAIIKVGGSLLTLPDVVSRLIDLLGQLPFRRVALLAGGGPAADVVREWDKTFRLGDEAAHRLAIQSLTMTAELLTRLLPDAKRADSVRSVDDSLKCGRLPILHAEPLLCEIEQNGVGPLPSGWHVTSDSIAAWLALHWPAHRDQRCPVLILAKSVDCPASNPTEPHDAVDPHFTQLAKRLVAESEIHWCNLRDDPLRVQIWSIAAGIHQKPR